MTHESQPVGAPRSADSIVVLGCRVLPSGRASATLSRRALLGVRAYRDGVAPKLIASGGRRWGGRAEACAIAEELTLAGVPEEAISLELRSLNTRENAFYVAEALAARGMRRVAIATCAWHMARALANFRAAGMDALPLVEPVRERGALLDLYRSAYERVCAWNDARGAGQALKRDRSSVS